MNTSYYAHEWYFPLEDMVEVFHKANYTYVWGKELLEGTNKYHAVFSLTLDFSSFRTFDLTP